MTRNSWNGLILLSAVALSGCAHGRTEPIIRVQTVETKIPVPVPCKAEVAVHKSYSDAAAEFLTDIRGQVVALLQGRKERMADNERLKGAVVGCGGMVTAK